MVAWWGIPGNYSARWLIVGARACAVAAVPRHTGCGWPVMGNGVVQRESEIGCLDAPEYLAAGSVECVELQSGDVVVVSSFRRCEL